jgi:hypothetical protein
VNASAPITGAAVPPGQVSNLDRLGASVARRDRLEARTAEIGKAGGTALAVEADITNRTQAEAAGQQAFALSRRLVLQSNHQFWAR